MAYFLKKRIKEKELLVQIYALEDKYGTEEIFDFIRDFRVAKVSFTSTPKDRLYSLS